MRSENFIYFLTVTGFFIGLIFAIFQGLEPFDFLLSVIIFFSVFYTIALASTGFFIKYLSVKQVVHLDKNDLEKTIDYQIEELDKKEDLIREYHYFIEQIEQEELEVYKEGNK